MDLTLVLMISATVAAILQDGVSHFSSRSLFYTFTSKSQEILHKHYNP